MDADKTAAEAAGIKYKKTDDFIDSYANNVLLESSLWDMRLILGKLDQQLGKNTVVQHSSVTLPWAQVKLLHYFLGLHLATHEIQFGRVQIPTNIVPPIPDQISEELRELKDPKAEEVHEALKSGYADFIIANPEAAQRGSK
jgi:hypothetical protein